MSVRSASSPPSARAERAPSRFDWRRVARHALTSRALDDAEETTNRNKATVPREHLVLYQFSARGHDVAQCVLGALLDHPHDAAGAYYRSRPLLLSLGLSAEDALASPLGRSGGFSDGRDIGVVCNLPTRGGPMVLPMAGDVGGQYTPVAGWAQSVLYHRDELGDRAWDGALGVALGGEASVATSGFWSALTMATTLKLPGALLHRGQRARDLGAEPHADAGREHRAQPGVVREPPRARRQRQRPGARRGAARGGVDHVRGGAGRRSCGSPCRACRATRAPTTRRGYRTEEEIAADLARDPLPALRRQLVPALMSEGDWAGARGEVERDVEAGARGRARAARAGPRRGAPLRLRGAAAPGDHEAMGGLTDAERSALGGPTRPARRRRRCASPSRAAHARARARGEPKLLVFGEDVG
jgi:2-oxoisovalerate dehydrogenase E1 component